MFLYGFLKIRQMCSLRFLNHPHVCRLESVKPSRGEVFYLRSILSVRSGDSYKDLRTFNGTLYDSYQEAAYAMGLFSNAEECVQAFEDAIMLFKTPSQLRYFFVHMLVNDCIETPIEFWNRYKGQLSYDHYLKARGNVVVAETRCMEKLNVLLEEYEKSLDDFGILFHHA